MQAAQREQLGTGPARVDDGEPAAHRDDDVTDAVEVVGGHGPEPARGHGVVAGEHVGPVCEQLAPGGVHVAAGAGLDVELWRPCLAGDVPHARGEQRLVGDVEPQLVG